MSSIQTMTMTHIVLALLAGVFAAQVFCRVLWREASALHAEGAPVFRALGGAVLRITLTAGFLMLAGGGEWAPTVAALTGFAVSRSAATRRIMRAL